MDIVVNVGMSLIGKNSSRNTRTVGERYLLVKQYFHSPLATILGHRWFFDVDEVTVSSYDRRYPL
jgi:hypothetical protein